MRGGRRAGQAEHPLDAPGAGTAAPQTIAETGLPGRPTSGAPAEPARHQRLARPHGDLVEIERQPWAEGGLLHQVEVADRGAAEGRRSGRRRGEREARRRGSRRCRGRWAGAAPRRPRPRAAPSSPKPFEETIWSGPGVVAGHDQLVAGRDQRHHRPARHRRPGRRSSRRGARGRPARGAAAPRRVRRRRSRRRRRGCCGSASRSGARARSRRRRRVDVLLDHHHVGAGGTGAPVKMRTASPGADPALEARAGGRDADRPRAGAGDGVGGAHRVAVHRRGGEGRLRRGPPRRRAPAPGRRRGRAAPPRRSSGANSAIRRACASATRRSAISAPRSARTCRLP